MIIWINEEDSNNKNNNKIQASSFNESTTEYIVKKGDSLWLIAKKYDVWVTDLLKWNNLKRNKPLQPGQILKLILILEASKLYPLKYQLLLK